MTKYVQVAMYFLWIARSFNKEEEKTILYPRKRSWTYHFVKTAILEVIKQMENWGLGHSWGRSPLSPISAALMRTSESKGICLIPEVFWPLLMDAEILAILKVCICLNFS